MLAEGAAIVDVGGESTRPGAEAVSADEELRRVVPVLEQLAGAPVSIDTSKAEVAAPGARAGRGARQRRDRPARRPGAGRGRRRVGRLPLPDAHAGRAADDAGRPALRRRRLGGRGLPRGAAARRRRRRDRRGAHLPRPRDRLRQDGRAQLRARAAAGRADRARAAGRDRLLAQELARQAARRPAGDDRLGRGERRRRRSRPTSAARRSCASTTSREHVEALAAAQAALA